MALLDRRTLILDNVTPQEIRAPRGGRDYLYIENHDAAKIYYEEDMPANAVTSMEIQAAGNQLSIKEFGQAGYGTGSGVPQGSIWLLGTGASQRVTVRQCARPLA